MKCPQGTIEHTRAMQPNSKTSTKLLRFGTSPSFNLNSTFSWRKRKPRRRSRTGRRTWRRRSGNLLKWTNKQSRGKRPRGRKLPIERKCSNCGVTDCTSYLDSLTRHLQFIGALGKAEG